MKKRGWLLGLVLLFPLTSYAEEPQIPIEGTVDTLKQEVLAKPQLRTDNVGKSSLFTKEEIQKLQAFQDEYWAIRNNDVTAGKFKVAPIIGPDQYTLGEFNPNTLDNATAYVNLLRKSAGMVPVKWTKERVEIAQYGAVGVAGTRQLTHNLDQFEKPKGMTDDFWQNAVSAARYSNLGKYGFRRDDIDSVPSLPLNTVTDAYMYEPGAGNFQVGHRTVILNPYYQTVGFGFAELKIPQEKTVEFSEALYAQGDGSNTVTKDHIATWPTNQTFPLQYVGNDFRWSLHFYNEGYGFNREQLKVTLTQDNSGKTWTFTDQQSDGEYTVTSIWGYNSVIFAPKDINYQEGDSFTVKVDGLTGTKSSYQYQTKLYDLTKKYEVEQVKGTYGTAPWTWDEDTQTLTFSAGEFPETGWNNNIQRHIENHSLLKGKKIKKINFSQDVTLSSVSAFLFESLSELEEIEGTQHLKTDKVTNMSRMFSRTKLKSLDLSSWNVENVVDMNGLFLSSTLLQQVQLANWNTKNVKNMAQVFYYLRALESLDIANWNTENVTSMHEMFFASNTLKSLELSNWNTKNVTTMRGMFDRMSALKSVGVTNWDTSKVNDMAGMFNENYALEQIDVSKWNTSNVKNMGSMFSDNRSLKSLDLSNWDTRNNRIMGYMFKGTTNLDTLTLGQSTRLHKTGLLEKKDAPHSGKWVHENGQKYYLSSKDLETTYDGSHAGTYTREKGKLKRFGTVSWTWDEPTQTVTFESGEFPESSWGYNIQRQVEWNAALNGKKIKKINFKQDVTLANVSAFLFEGLSELEEIEGAQHLKTDKVTNMSRMFSLTKLKSLDLSSWNIENVVDMNGLFLSSTLLQQVKLANWNTKSVTNMAQVFSGLQALESLDIANWNTENVTSMHEMFLGSNSLTSLELSNWNTKNVTTMRNMFSRMSALKSVGVTNWDTSKVNDMAQMFHENYALEQIDVANWNTSNVKNMGGMFRDNRSLKSLDLSNWDTRNNNIMNAMFYGTDSLDTLTLNEAFRFKDTRLPEKQNWQYTGRWIHENGQHSYLNSKEFQTNYDGSTYGTYTREIVK